VWAFADTDDVNGIKYAPRTMVSHHHMWVCAAAFRFHTTAEKVALQKPSDENYSRIKLPLVNRMKYDAFQPKEWSVSLTKSPHADWAVLSL
jgi:hypothetical protein